MIVGTVQHRTIVIIFLLIFHITAQIGLLYTGWEGIITQWYRTNL